MGQEKESFSGAYLSNGDPSRDPVSEVRQRTDTLPKTSSIQSSRHRAEIAKRDAQIASLQQRCAQLELDLADDRQLEQLLDEYREKLDSAAEENRLLADALEVERRNQQVLRDKITTYKERLATWPAKLATEMRMLESKHELSAKEARLLAQRLEAEKRQLQDELQRSWDTVASLRSELEQARAASVEATQKQLETVRRECEQAHRQSLIKLEAEFDAYRSEAKLALERWHTRCIEMERELTELSELVAYYRGKSEDLASSHEAFEQRTRNQEMRLNAALQRESSRAACLETEVEALQNRIGDLQAVIDELETGATLRTEYARARRCPPAYHTVDANEP
jgi:chromosome segregation ATPase